VPEITRDWVEKRLQTLQVDLETAFANWSSIRGRYEEMQGWLAFLDGNAIVDGQPLKSGEGDVPSPPSDPPELTEV
jgi:hypothetical protein